jgi:ATP-dependent DNA helicase RecG
MTDEARWWQLPVEYVKGVGPKRAELLRMEAGIHTAGDLISYFPYRHVDRTRFDQIAFIREDQPYVQLRGRLSDVRLVERGPHRRLSATLTDPTGSVELTWFQGLRFIRQSLVSGAEYIVFGRPVKLGRYFSLAHPEMERTVVGSEGRRTGLIPLYSTTEKMKKGGLDSRALENILRQLIGGLSFTFCETLSQDVIEGARLCSRHEALCQIHFPPSHEALQKALFRLKFEELFYLRLQLIRLNLGRKQERPGIEVPRVNRLVKEFYEHHLPFRLTGAQVRVLREIREDMASGRQMSRLLQGDVGSGKTIVALLAMLSVVDAGFQACLMAPTEILAQQHFFSLESMLRPLRVPVALLTGSTPRAVRYEILPSLAEGRLPIVVGTHALLEDEVRFRNLALAVIDEQHRFGVAQRGRMWVKNVIPPHILIMTATPIPRTLALTVYGDLDVSILDELPPGRKPITTRLIFPGQMEELLRLVQVELEKGRQVYWVFPLIEESDKLDYTPLVKGFEKVKKAFPQHKVVMLHGKMSPAEKEETMQLFASGQAHILVATTVIEVGVNVPNASVMIIEHAERFGLAQLHQLRGRVGRGAEQSYCILLASQNLSHEGRQRLQVMTSTQDGFRIAEEDLRLRGAGDVEGTRQSGNVKLRIADLSRDLPILQLAEDQARRVLSGDPYLISPIHEPLRRTLQTLRKAESFWKNIA